MDISCPYCGSEYEIEESTYGKYVDCLDCGKSFVAGQRRGRGDAAAKQLGELASRAAKSVGEMMSEDGIKKSVESIGGRFRAFTGTERLDGFSLVSLFSEVFKKHNDEEVEKCFTIGTPETIPNIADVDVSWPRPWMFFRALIGALAVYFLFACAWDWFKNVNLIPGLILTGAMAIPLSTLLFFFEVNARRNVSLYQVLRMVLYGGIVSLIFSLVLFKLPLENMGWLGASIAGVIEEPGKLLALVFVARAAKYRYKLNGLLLGACVGAGFSIFESMGYAFQVLLHGGISAMNDNIIFRGLLSPFSHIAWTAICGAAMWRVKEGRPFKVSMVANGRFWHLFVVSVLLHMAWNAEFELPFFGKQISLGLIAWLVVFALIQEGLKELRAEKTAAQKS